MTSLETTYASVLDRAKSAEFLDQRIGAYASRQTLDLNEWVFSEVSAPAKGTVLELCSGTGMQTYYLAKQVGPGGRVFAVDASEEALLKTAARCTGVGGNVIPLSGDIDDLAAILDRAGVRRREVDMCFCAYGLYYAKNVQQVLDLVLGMLSPQGILVIVGPYGRNNQELFDVLTTAGVSIPGYVTYTSRDFMPVTILPRLVNDFSRMVVRTAKNYVSWATPLEVLTYWRNSTFFDAGRESYVSALLDTHFAAHDVFVNQKRIMSITASQQQLESRGSKNLR